LVRPRAQAGRLLKTRQGSEAYATFGPSASPPQEMIVVIRHRLGLKELDLLIVDAGFLHRLTTPPITERRRCRPYRRGYTSGCLGPALIAPLTLVAPERSVTLQTVMWETPSTSPISWSDLPASSPRRGGAAQGQRATNPPGRRSSPRSRGPWRARWDSRVRPRPESRSGRSTDQFSGRSL
jgi:hypothetical protein